MPIHEFKCRKGHISEHLFLTFASAASEENRIIDCKTEGCFYPAFRVEFSMPGQAILLGDGFYKPSPSGNKSYKRSDPDKAAKEAINAVGGGKKLVGAVKSSK